MSHFQFARTRRVMTFCLGLSSTLPLTLQAQHLPTAGHRYAVPMRATSMRSKISALITPQMRWQLNHPTKILNSPRADRNSAIGTQAATDPILYTQRIANSTPNGFAAGYPWDVLWGFPTVGYSPDTDTNIPLYGNTLRADSTAPNNTALVSLGNIGKPATITRFRWAGALAQPNATLTQVSGLYSVIFYDGANLNSSSLTLAKRADGTNAVYTFRMTAPVGTASNFTTRSFDMPATTTAVKITDPQGRFGMLVVAVDDTATTTDPADTQWFAYGGMANGENGGVVINANTSTYFAYNNFGPGADNPSDPFNYGAIDSNVNLISPPLNYYMVVQGLEADGVTVPVRGNLTGNIRLRGIDIPANAAPEARPHQYTLGFYSTPAPAGSQLGTLVTERTLFSQPTYDASGSLLRNFRIDGLPAGTFDMKVTYVPSDYVSGSGSTATIVQDSIRKADQYPGSDYVPAIVRNVVITSSGPVSATNSGTVVDLLPTRPIRLERFGDINNDGAIDFGDLTFMLQGYNALDGEPLYDQYKAADITGGPTAEFASAGPPDGAIDFGDLSALLQYYNTILDE